MKPLITRTQTINHKAVLAVMLVILAVPILFIGTSAQMIHVWNVNETFTHGYLIFPISLWLIWRNRKHLMQCSFEPEIRPLLLLILTQVAWFLGHTVDVQVVKQIAMIGMIPVFIWMLMGRKILYVILFPICYLFFAIPIGQGLIPSMMDLTADFTIFMIQLSGVPVFRDGLFFSLPSGNWSVVEECSGVRYLIASLALGSIYAYITYQSSYKRVIFLLAAGLVPIIANGFRAYGIVMLGHLSGMKLATGVDHLLYGWVFFGAVIFTMFYVGSFWAEPAPGTETHNSVKLKQFLPSEYKKSMLVVLATALVSTIALKSIAYQISNPDIDSLEPVSLTLPRNFEGWQRLDDVNIGWSPIFQSPDVKTEDAYRFGNEIVQVNIGYYSNQRQGAEAVSTQSRITNPLSGVWKLTRRVDLQIGEFYITESEIRHGDDKILVWHWYHLGNWQTPNRYIAKVFEAYNKIIGNRHDASMITIATRLNDLTKDRSKLRGFIEVFQKEINEILDKLPSQNVPEQS